MNPDPPEMSDPVAAARALGKACDWPAAFELLSAAEQRRELSAEGLEMLANCARWVGEDGLVAETLERAHQAYGPDTAGAARTALSLCYTHMDACRAAQAASWWQRADELIRELPEGPEHGLHAWFAGRSLGESGDLEGQEAAARRALEIAGRYDDRNVEALALMDLAHVATYRGQSGEARKLLDRATALALGGEIGMLESGLVFCNAIIACRARGDWDRAEEWTHTANRWVQRVQVTYFPGLCRVHRAEVLRVRGELLAAETEAIEAERLLTARIPRWTALARIELGEIRRRRGDLEGALTAFRRARELGVDPQPGLALVLLGMGDTQAAHRGIERFWNSKPPTLLCGDRANLLRARVSVAIAAGEESIATAALAELEALAAGDAVTWDQAAVAQARGELAMAKGDARAATEQLTEARGCWAELDAPYELACASMLIGEALVADGDPDVAALEFETARGIFDRIGARLDRDRAAAALAGPSRQPAEPATAEPPDDDARFRIEGDYWTLNFGGRAIRLRDGRGPRYLAALLAEPGRDRLALELAMGSSGLPARGSAEEVLDAEARSAYRTRLADLGRELADAEEKHDLARAEQARAEIEAITAHLSAALGLGGRARRAGSETERARQSVTKAIRQTIRKLNESHTALGRYLSNTIRTGTTCRFDPDPGRPMRWIVDQA